MSETIRVRLLLARMGEDTEPSVIAAVDEVIWENWDDADEAAWVKAGKKVWGIDYDTEFKIVVAEFAPQHLVDAFATLVVPAASVREADVTGLSTVYGRKRP